MSTPTPTPRTDAVKFEADNWNEVVSSSFARQLETELAASQAREAQLRGTVCRLIGIIKLHTYTGYKEISEALRAAESAVSQPPPPVVPLAVAQQLAEALEEMKSQHGCSCGHPSCRHCWRTNDATAALAAFAPYQKKEGE